MHTETKVKTHTPTPCFWNGGGLDGKRWVADATGKPIADADVLRAVNAHDELVTALKRVQKALRQESGPEAADTFSMCIVIKNVVDAALAKAEARP